MKTSDRKSWTREEDEILGQNSILPDKWLLPTEFSNVLPDRSPCSIRNRRKKIGLIMGRTDYLLFMQRRECHHCLGCGKLIKKGRFYCSRNCSIKNSRKKENRRCVSRNMRSRIFNSIEYFSSQQLYALREKIDYLLAKC